MKAYKGLMGGPGTWQAQYMSLQLLSHFSEMNQKALAALWSQACAGLYQLQVCVLEDFPKVFGSPSWEEMMENRYRFLLKGLAAARCFEVTCTSRFAAFLEASGDLGTLGRASPWDSGGWGQAATTRLYLTLLVILHLSLFLYIFLPHIHNLT